MTRNPYKTKPNMRTPGPFFKIEIENLKNLKTENFDVLIDTGTDDRIILMIQNYKKMGFQTLKMAVGKGQLTTGTGDFVPSWLDKGKITIGDMLEKEISIRGAAIDMNVLGREMINKLILLLHGPRKFCHATCMREK